MSTKTLLLLAILAAVALASPWGEAKNLPPLQSVKVALPQDTETFPAGAGSKLADNDCRSCHSVEMVLFQPALPHAAWEAEVNKMRNVYKAPIDSADVAPLVDYLTSIKAAH